MASAWELWQQDTPDNLRQQDVPVDSASVVEADEEDDVFDMLDSQAHAEDDHPAAQAALQSGSEPEAAPAAAARLQQHAGVNADQAQFDHSQSHSQWPAQAAVHEDFPRASERHTSVTVSPALSGEPTTRQDMTAEGASAATELLLQQRGYADADDPAEVSSAHAGSQDVGLSGEFTAVAEHTAESSAAHQLINQTSTAEPVQEQAWYDETDRGGHRGGHNRPSAQAADAEPMHNHDGGQAAAHSLRDTHSPEASLQQPRSVASASRATSAGSSPHRAFGSAMALSAQGNATHPSPYGAAPPASNRDEQHAAATVSPAASAGHGQASGDFAALDRAPDEAPTESLHAHKQAGPPAPQPAGSGDADSVEPRFVTLSGPPSGFAAMLTDSMAASTPGQEFAASPTRYSVDAAHAASGSLSASGPDPEHAAPSRQYRDESGAQEGDVGDVGGAQDAAGALATALQSATEAVAHVPAAPAPPPALRVTSPTTGSGDGAGRGDDAGTPNRAAAPGAAEPASQTDRTPNGSTSGRRGGLFGLLGRRRGGAGAVGAPDSPALTLVAADAVDSAVLDAARAFADGMGIGEGAATGEADVSRELLRLNALRAQTERAHAEAARDADAVQTELEEARRQCSSERSAAVSAQNEATQAREHLAALHSLFMRALQDVVLLQLRCEHARCAQSIEPALRKSDNASQQYADRISTHVTSYTAREQCKWDPVASCPTLQHSAGVYCRRDSAKAQAQLRASHQLDQHEADAPVTPPTADTDGADLRQRACKAEECLAEARARGDALDQRLQQARRLCSAATL